MSFGGDTPEVPDPAKRPERRKAVQPEDITVSNSDQTVSNSDQDTEGDLKGRKALRRPVGDTSSATNLGSTKTGVNF